MNLKGKTVRLKRTSNERNVFIIKKEFESTFSSVKLYKLVSLDGKKVRAFTRGSFTVCSRRACDRCKNKFVCYTAPEPEISNLTISSKPFVPFVANQSANSASSIT